VKYWWHETGKYLVIIIAPLAVAVAYELYRWRL